MSYFREDRPQGAGAIAAARRAPRSAPAPMLGRRSRRSGLGAISTELQSCPVVDANGVCVAGLDPGSIPTTGFGSGTPIRTIRVGTFFGTQLQNTSSIPIQHEEAGPVIQPPSGTSFVPPPLPEFTPPAVPVSAPTTSLVAPPPPRINGGGGSGTPGTVTFVDEAGEVVKVPITSVTAAADAVKKSNTKLLVGLGAGALALYLLFGRE